MKLLLTAICCITLLMAQVSKAVIYDFDTFTADGTPNAVSGIDLSVNVTMVSDSQVRFEFHNDGTKGIVKEICFEEGILSGVAAFDAGDQEGVDFDIDLHPNHAILKSIDSDEFFAIGATPSPIKNGIGPGEWLAVIFDLQQGSSFSDLILQLNDGDFRIGQEIHGVSSNLITVNGAAVPEPASAVILGIGTMLLRRKKKFAGVRKKL